MTYSIRCCAAILGLILAFGSIASAAPRAPEKPTAGTTAAPTSADGDESDGATARMAQTIVLPTVSSPDSKASGDSKSYIDFGIAALWPLIVIVVLWALSRSERFWNVLNSLGKRVSKIGKDGVSFEIDAAEAGRQKAYFQDSFKELKENAETQYDQVQDAFDIREHLRNAIEVGLVSVLKTHVPGGTQEVGEYRATIHVPDIVFKDSLYQLVDYYPAQEKGGRGRRFSMRYGIIGRSWRLEESVGEGEAVDPPDSNATPEDRRKWIVVRDRLVREWGMFPEEAALGSHGRPSYLCVLLKVGTKQGILYVDSKRKDAFGTAGAVVAAVAKALEVHPECQKLATQLEKTMTPLKLRGPRLQVEEK